VLNTILCYLYVVYDLACSPLFVAIGCWCYSNSFSGRTHPGQYAGTCRVCFQIGNSFSQKRITLNFYIYIFVVFIKYEKSRDENGQETDSGGSSPPGGAGPLQVTPPYGESTPELISVPVSSCDFASMFNFLLYKPPDCPRFVYRVFVVFSFRAISVRSCSQF
jgi:hypothetical protein